MNDGEEIYRNEQCELSTLIKCIEMGLLNNIRSFWNIVIGNVLLERELCPTLIITMFVRICDQFMREMC